MCVCVFGYVVLNFWLNIRSQNFLWSIYLSKEKKRISNFFTMNDRLDDELNNPVPLQLEPVPLPRDVLRTFPTVGTVLRVIFDQGMQKHLLRFLHTGKWVKFVNVLCEVHSGLWRGVLTPFTKLQYTPNEDHLVSAWQRFLLLLKLWLTLQWINNNKTSIFSIFLSFKFYLIIIKWKSGYGINILLRKCSNVIVFVRLYNERLSLKWGRIPYSSFPWPSNITGFLFINSLIKDHK